ncbi:hypothetical protein CHLNCDRAFT_133320 [Chlorella variabilis]|uniref:ASCH domain-containing protein n=1 Tax=Chlorella variabilis TaxID=554065 RepID=E1Z2V0_CHLVA|nr:hypothetical protein CHLNCDRAFT_133320 [Chlorella variabilis]EFN59729.1 hypothetical protein CHLNCDRAFT_133320 [Chlorella variabilis]|eukprot:XP_005851831.1 hypothetical protein CHLNCDRAFT_133320 [Chlorella variabilis]
MAAAGQRQGAPIDAGVCLSMHQPWASLLVYGIKRIEGRGWPTEHRGRLWIAATAKQPTPQEIQEMEEFYRAVHGSGGQQAVELPPAYPTGVLLGCVDVAEQVEAWEGLPGGLIAEVGSPYCFLCQAPQRLVVPQQMRGFPKIFQLEKKIHKTAQLGLKPAPNGRDFGWAAFGAAPSTHKYQELQRKMDAARGAPGAAGDSQRPCRAADGGEEEGGGHGPVAKTSGSQSPRAAAAAAAAAAVAGLPRAVALQQQQQDPRRRLRAVQKKLRQIAVLEERQRERWAAQLLPEEAAKLAQREQLEAEAAALQAEVG